MELISNKIQKETEGAVELRKLKNFELKQIIGGTETAADDDGGIVIE